ncbi:uncharacterized protein LOC134773744 [Penaeus indicus]|uniref:uncharacterized protein LOC134773744 n=1 Tax=Penaeus indicus TaxID=29960 RepID=UPI00300D938A
MKRRETGFIVTGVYVWNWRHVTSRAPRELQLGTDMSRDTVRIVHEPEGGRAASCEVRRVAHVRIGFYRILPNTVCLLREPGDKNCQSECQRSYPHQGEARVSSRPPVLSG